MSKDGSLNHANKRLRKLGRERSKSVSNNIIERFIKESLNMITLPIHPNIITTYTINQSNGNPYIVMEYIDGPNLHQKIDEEQQLKPDCAINYAIQICKGLNTAHQSKGLIHRDLKPENILISKDNIVKITDFGLSKSLIEETTILTEVGCFDEANTYLTSEYIQGTIRYMAPEQALYPGKTDPKLDIFSFGVLLYEMLSGKLPFKNNSIEKLLKDMNTADVVPIKEIISDIPDSLNFLIMKCLNIKPENRYNNFQELIDELTRIAGEIGIEPPSHLSAEWINIPLMNLIRKTDALINLGLNTKAINQLEAASFRAFNNGSLWGLLGTAYGNLGQDEEAIVCFDKAFEIGIEPEKRALHNKGHSLLSLDREDEAIICFQRAIEIDPCYVKALISLGVVYYNKHEYNLALDYIEKALDLEKDNIEALIFKSLIVFDLGKKDLGMELLNKVYNTGIESPHLLLHLAQAYFHVGDINKASYFAKQYMGLVLEIGDNEIENFISIAIAGEDKELLCDSFKYALINPRSKFRELLKNDHEDFSDLDKIIIEALVRGKQFNEALELIQNKLINNPDSLELLMQKAYVLKNAGDFQNAIELYNLILEKDPDNTDIIHKKAVALLKSNQLLQSLEEYNKLLTINSEDHDALYNRPFVLSALEKYDEALIDCEKVLNLNPHDLPMLSLKGQIYLNTKKVEQAIDVFNVVLAEDPENIEVLNAKFHCFYICERFPEAMDCVSTILSIYPKDAEAWQKKASLLLRMGNYEKLGESLKCFLCVLEIDERMYQALTGIGFIHVLLKDYTNAAIYFKRALSINPDYEIALNNLLNIDKLIKDNTIEHSFKSQGTNFNLVITEPGMPNIVLSSDMFNDIHLERQKAITLYENGKYTEAIPIFKTIVDVIPTDYEIWYFLGLSLDKNGEYLQAINCFDKSLSMFPSSEFISLELLNAKGEALRKTGKYKEAIEVFDKVINLDENYEFAWNNKGICLKNLSQYDKAKDCYLRALQINPKLWEALGNLGSLYCILEDYDNAIECCKKLSKIEGKNSLISIVKANIYLESGKLKKAKKEILKAQKIDPDNPNIKELWKEIGVEQIGFVELADELRNNPLALEQAKACVANNQWSLEKYLKYYRELKSRSFEKTEKPLDISDILIITTSISFQQISMKASRQLMYFSAFLAPNPISKSIFQKGAEFLEEPLSEVASNELELNQALSELGKYSLIKIFDDGSWAVEQSVQEIFRNSLDEKNRRFLISSLINLFDHLFLFDSNQHETWDNCELYVSHILALGQYIKELEEKNLYDSHVFVINDDESYMEDEKLVKLLDSVSLYLFHFAKYEIAEPLFKQVLAMCERIFGDEHLNTVNSLNKLALLYYNQGKYDDAEPLFQRALAITERLCGPEDLSTASVLNNLALLYNNKGKYDTAEPLYFRALAIHEQALGKMHPENAHLLNNLGLLYFNQCKYEAAKNYYQRALEIYEQGDDTENLDTAYTLNNLALLYNNQGKYEVVEPLYKRTLAIYERILGKGHPTTAQTQNNLARLYCNQKKYKDAEPLFQQALTIREHILGQEHHLTAESLNDLAILYLKQRKYEAAEPLFQRALAIYNKALGEEHPFTLCTVNNLAGLYINLGKYEAAESLLQHALTIQKQVLGMEHPYTFKSIINLAILYYNQDKYQDAELYYQQALAIRERITESEYSDISTAFNYLQELHENPGKKNEEQQLFMWVTR
jgi:tetratricopeptide (TPR) repeat protein/tRNA A-37 threonylcarbamoyl transferase component Bud32